MKERLIKYAEIIPIIAGLFIVIVTSAALIGEPVRLVHIIGIVAGAFGAGVGTGAFAAKKHLNKKKL